MKSGLNHTRTTPDVKHTDAKLDAKGTESVEKAVNKTIKRLEESMEAQGEDWATEDFAEQMISDPAWVEEAVAND